MKLKLTASKTLAIIGLASVLVVTGCKSNTPIITNDDKPISYPGNDIDAQEKELASFLNSQGISYRRQGTNMIINLPEALTFATGSATLKTQGVSAINQIATVMSKYSQTTINVVGYTDSTGSDAVNNKLSLQRAQSVAKIFRNKGIGEFRINPVGSGSASPIATNDTAEGRAQNRRVELVLSPLQLKR